MKSLILEFKIFFLSFNFPYCAYGRFVLGNSLSDIRKRKPKVNTTNQSTLIIVLDFLFVSCLIMHFRIFSTKKNISRNYIYHKNTK